MAKIITVIKVSAPVFNSAIEIHDGKINCAGYALKFMRDRRMTEKQILYYCRRKKWSVNVQKVKGLSK